MFLFAASHVGLLEDTLVPTGGQYSKAIHINPVRLSGGLAIKKDTADSFHDHQLQCGAPKMAKLVYNSNTYDSWYANNYSYWCL